MDKMKREDIINNFDKILIIGNPNSGKTTLFNDMILNDRINDHWLLHTDDYKFLPYTEQLYEIMDVVALKKKWLIEGIQGYRFLRKYAQLKDETWKPDLIIICENHSRPVKDKHQRMIKGLDKIWEDYNDLEKNIPEIIYHLT